MKVTRVFSFGGGVQSVAVLVLQALGNDRLTAIQTGGIRQFVILIRKDYREDTAAAHLRALHKFFKWCSDEYDIKNPMRNIRHPRRRWIHSRNRSAKPRRNRCPAWNANRISTHTLKGEVTR